MSDAPIVTTDAEPDTGAVIQLAEGPARRKVPALHLMLSPDESVLARLEKAVEDTARPPNAPSLVSVAPWPLDFRQVLELVKSNTHHSTCIHTKSAASVGVGHTDDKVHDKLNPLTSISWQDTLKRWSLDYEQTGSAYLEIVRADATSKSPIVGIHHLPVSDVYVQVEDSKHNSHYLVRAEDGSWMRFARFGQLERLNSRMDDNRMSLGSLGGSAPTTGVISSEKTTSEVIAILEPNSLSRWYGFPSWIAATAAIELVACMHQEAYDFFLNSGVPEFMLFILGKTLHKSTWDTVKSSMQRLTGPGNAHKSLALNIPDPEVEVQLEKLALEGRGGGEVFKDMQDILGLEIVTAHRVPPILGGIQIPGKMGAANEVMNALLAFQTLVVGPTQFSIQQVLGRTLGGDLGGGLGLSAKDFEFQKLHETIAEGMEALQPADTMSRMRESVPEATAKGRNVSDGLKKAMSSSEGVKRLADAMIGKLVEMAATSADEE